MKKKAKIKSKKGQAKVAKVMHEYKEKTLYSGSGQKVKDIKQALAIALSEGRKEKR